MFERRAVHHPSSFFSSRVLLPLLCVCHPTLHELPCFFWKKKTLPHLLHQATEPSSSPPSSSSSAWSLIFPSVSIESAHQLLYVLLPSTSPSIAPTILLFQLHRTSIILFLSLGLDQHHHHLALPCWVAFLSAFDLLLLWLECRRVLLCDLLTVTVDEAAIAAALLCRTNFRISGFQTQGASSSFIFGLYLQNNICKWPKPQANLAILCNSWLHCCLIVYRVSFLFWL